MTSFSSNIDLVSEIKNFDYCWHQGATTFQEGQRSIRKIAELLKLSYGNSFSTKYIINKMMEFFGHLNGISNWKLEQYFDDVK